MPTENNFGGSFASGMGSGLASGATEGLFGTLFGGWNARRQWSYQKKQMALQQKYALEQMERQAYLQRLQFDYENEYNSPVNVFKRFRQAGINPAAVVGSSGASMSATLPMPGSPVGGHVSGGPAIGGMEQINVDPVAASQIRFNNAAAANQQSSANLSDEKAATETSVRNMLAATIDEKSANAYFTTQKSIYQQMVNAKTTEMLDAQILELRSHANQLIASGNLSEAQVELVREQPINTFFDSCFKRAQIDTQSELAKYYRSLTGFVSLQAEDLDYTIQSLATAHSVTTYTMDKDHNVVPVTYEVSGYDAKRLSSIFGAMKGSAEAAREAIRADWENPNQWNQNIDIYWDNINGSIESAFSILSGLKKLAIQKEAVGKIGGARTRVTQTFDGSGNKVGMTRTFDVPHQ